MATRNMEIFIFHVCADTLKCECMGYAQAVVYYFGCRHKWSLLNHFYFYCLQLLKNRSWPRRKDADHLYGLQMSFESVSRLMIPVQSKEHDDNR